MLLQSALYTYIDTPLACLLLGWVCRFRIQYVGSEAKSEQAFARTSKMQQRDTPPQSNLLKSIHVRNNAVTKTTTTTKTKEEHHRAQNVRACKRPSAFKNNNYNTKTINLTSAN